MEKVELHKQVKNLEMAVNLEAKIESNLSKAMNEAKEMMELNKEELIRKDLEDLYKGEPQAFQTLYNAMQMFSDEIIMVEEGLERELKATREYLQSKHWWAEDAELKGRKGCKVVHDITSSGSEGARPAAIQKKEVNGLKEVDWGMAQKALQEEPEGSKQLTVFWPPETEAGKIKYYMALLSTDELAKEG
jgi:hypothetical protein